MLGFIARRLAVSIPVLAGILIVTFGLARMVPGEPCKSILGDKATAPMCEAFNKKFGFDRSIPEQFYIYVKQLSKGELGDSIRYSRPVSQILVERFPLTIEMAVFALILATFVGIILGIVSAMRHNTLTDVSTMVAANVGISMPVFWLGLMLAYLFGFLLKDTIFWLPPSGRLTAGISSTPFYVAWGWDVAVSSPLGRFYQFIANHYIFNALITGDWVVFRDAIKHMIMPVVTLATIPMAIIARMTRSSLLEVLGRDYIRTARAKGLMEPRVVRIHALGNAMLPVVTILGLQMGALLGGAVLTETVFGLAGVGRMLVEAINARDYPIVQAFTVIIAVSYMAINIVVDISYSFLDPRVRLQ